jgi:hypothetical protein
MISRLDGIDVAVPCYYPPTAVIEYKHHVRGDPVVTQFLLLPSKLRRSKHLYIPAEHLLKSPSLAVLIHIRITTGKRPNGFLRNLIWKFIRYIFGPFQSPFNLDNFNDQFTLNLTAFLLA